LPLKSPKNPKFANPLEHWPVFAVENTEKSEFYKIPTTKHNVTCSSDPDFSLQFDHTKPSTNPYPKITIDCNRSHTSLPPTKNHSCTNSLPVDSFQLIKAIFGAHPKNALDPNCAENADVPFVFIFRNKQMLLLNSVDCAGLTVSNFFVELE
jgi:hypothetical protein